MIFRDFVIKSVKKSIRKYTAYLGSVLFCVISLVIYFSIKLNDNFKEVFESRLISALYNIGVIILIAFVLFFIIYSLVAFLRFRSKEFGIYLSIGMNKKDIIKLLITENTLVIFLALVLGIPIGAGISKLLEQFVGRILGYESLPSNFVIDGYLITIAIFILITIVVDSAAAIYIKKSNLLDLISKDRKVKRHKAHWILGLIGVFLILIGFSILSNLMRMDRSEVIDYNSYYIKSMVRFIAISGVGLYLTLINMGASIIVFLKKKKDFYVKRLLLISEMNFKFSQNNKIIYISTLISLLVIVLISSAFSLYADEIRKVEGDQPYHLMYLVNDNEEKINEIIKRNSEVKVVEEKNIDFLYLPNSLNVLNEGREIKGGERIIISEEAYNKLTGEGLKLNKNEVINVALDNLPIRQEQSFYNHIRIDCENRSFKLSFKGEKRKCIINSGIVSEKFVYVVDNHSYEQLKLNTSQGNIGGFRLINFNSWENSEKLVNKIKPFISINSRFNFEKNIISRLEYRNDIRKVNLSRLFIVSFMGAIFIIAIGGISYFKMLTEINDEVTKYKALIRIGISQSQIRKLVRMQQALVLFTPVVLGIIMGSAFIIIISAGSIMEKQLMESLWLISILYIVVTGIFYAICNRFYLKSLR